MIKGLGASSDGRAKGLTAPRPEGQVRALRRAYEKAGVAPGDGRLRRGPRHRDGGGRPGRGRGARPTSSARPGRRAGACALGSVKSLIGHTKCAAGLAGLINASLALYHRVLPPTIGVETPNPKADFADSPFHVSTRPRPWLHAEPDRPRRAGVSAFGFGGTNFHAVLEAYEGDPSPRRSPPSRLAGRAARLAGRRPQPAARGRSTGSTAPLDAGAGPAAPRPGARAERSALGIARRDPRLAIVATSLDDLRDKLDGARRTIAEGRRRDSPTRAGSTSPNAAAGQGRAVAFLFPGQGSQSPDMLGELAVCVPEVLAGFEAFDAALERARPAAVGPRVFPPPAFDDARDRAAEKPPWRRPRSPSRRSARRASGLLGLARGASGSSPTSSPATATASSSRCTRRASSRSRRWPSSRRRGAGSCWRPPASEPGAMAAVPAGPDGGRAAARADSTASSSSTGTAERRRSSRDPRGGRPATGDRARSEASAAGRLPVACGFHSPLVAAAQRAARRPGGEARRTRPAAPVYSNVTADPTPPSPARSPRSSASTWPARSGSPR